ncbi:helix-turn-helix transcriptional regulator [Bradyrhizobium sp. 521_C7_N1_3]|uniref:helix-turn-helix transcriptional regulator n=1 Tax=Bradyrhizobium sp. 521_C7_N1_3 TaxID=3240368 RepID=UPI003F890EC2
MNTDQVSNPSPRRQASGDDFTRKQFDWLRQVAFDSELPPAASRVATALTKYFSREHDGWAWMSQATLARDLGMPERTVRYALSALVDDGHLVTKRRGKKETNLYHLQLKNSESDRQAVADHEPRDRQPTATHPGVTGKNQQSDRQESARVTGNPLPPNPLNEPLEEPIELRNSLQLDLVDEDSRRRDPESPSYTDSDFEKWWAQVPRKVAKGAAAMLYRHIVDKGEATPGQLMAGMLRYAAEVANREQRYIAHPSTWLSQGRWSDEPAAPIAGTIDQNGDSIQMPPPNRPPWHGRPSNLQRAMEGGDE